jgi:hypothetical protein
MFGSLVDELRTHSTQWLESRQREVIGAQRELAAEELAIVRVLDERGRIDVTSGAHGDSARVVRAKVETARALEGLPALGAAACEGRLSSEQLTSAAKLADEDTDAEWARRAPNVDPVDLARLARNGSTPTAEDSRARYQARGVRMWWTGDQAVLHVHGQLPDVMGATFEATITKLAEDLAPLRGHVWDSFEHRAADALVSLCDPASIDDEHAPAAAARPVLQVAVPLHGPAAIAGVPIADSLLEQLRANASIEPVLVDDDEAPIVIGKRSPGLSPKIARAVLLRDGRCRMPGCERRRGLEVHHLVPRSRGGSDDIANLAAVCPTHHRLLVPHGSLALVGNPNQPDGLELVDTRERPPP